MDAILLSLTRKVSISFVYNGGFKSRFYIIVFPDGRVVRNLPANAGDLGWEDSPEKEMATHSSILAMENSMDRGAWWATVRGVAKESDMTERLNSNNKTVEFGL